MTSPDPHDLLVADASGDRRLVSSTVDDPLALELGAARVGTLWFGRTLGGVHLDVARALHVSRYGDAALYADPADPGIALRIVSGLQSGRIVETLVRQPVPDAAEPVVRAPFARPVLTIDGASSQQEEAPGPSPVQVAIDQGVRTLRHPPGLDAAMERLDALAAAVRHPGHEPAGLHRQIVDVADAASLWVLHRGFLRRVQGTHDDVADHRQVRVAIAVVRRVAHIDDLREHRFEVAVDRASRAFRGALLAAPFALGWLGGLVWWVAVTAGFASAGGAVALGAALRRPRLRPWILLTPFPLYVVGTSTVGVIDLALHLALSLVIVLSEPVALRRLARSFVLGYAAPKNDGLAVVPLANLVEGSGR